MAKKKENKPPIVNGLDDTYIVEKSRPLMLMKEVPFALGELKVLDTYLSRINARDPEAMTVRFSKEEYEDLMGIERMRPERLNKYVTALQGKIIRVPDPSARTGWRNYNLFDESGFEQDENGQWWIDLCCTPKAKNLFFNIDGVGYIRYQLKNVLPLASKHSVLLYIYLLDNRFRKSWEISLDNLRQSVFRCDDVESYREYKYFKRDILDKAIKEVNEKTDLTFEYEPVRFARKVVKIKFNLVKDEVVLPEIKVPQLPEQSQGYAYGNEQYEQTNMFEEEKELSREERNRLDWIEAVRDIVKSSYDFTDDEIEEVVVATHQSAWWSDSKPVLLGNFSLQYDALCGYVKRQYSYTKARSKAQTKRPFLTYLVDSVQNNYAKVPVLEQPNSSQQEHSFEVDDFYASALKRSMGNAYDPEFLKK